MVVGIIGWELEMVGCQSLKEKRSVLKSLKDRLRNRYNVSVAETGYQDLWQRAELAACVISSARRPAESVLEGADRLVAGEPRVRLIRTERSFV
jgi:hypothetical protein